MKLSIMDLPLRGGTRFKFFGPYAATSADRVRDYYGQFKPALKIKITRAVLETPNQDGRCKPVTTPVAGHTCIFQISEPVGQALQHGIAGTFWCGDGAMVRFTDGRTGEQHDIRLPPLPKRFVQHLQLEALAHKQPEN